jgi:hypothetical protein
MFALLPQVNFVAVIVASLAALIVGFVWYLPPTFGKSWATFVKQYTGLSDADLMPANIPLTMGLWLLGFLVNAFALAVLINGLGINTLSDGLILAVLVWLGMGLSISSWPVIHARQPRGLWLLNGIAFLIMQIVMSIILILWR